MQKLRGFLCVLIAIMLFLTTAQAASPSASDPAPTVRVYLKRLALQDAADLILDGSYACAAGNGTEMLFPRGSKVSLRLREGEIILFYEGLSMSLGKQVVFSRNASDTLDHDGIRFVEGGNLYPGTLKLDVKDGALRPILTISVEDYLLGVLPYEMSNSFPLEALKAQAVCARTYALAHANGTDEYDLVDTTNDQVFKGVYFGNTNVIKAVQATAGIVGTWKGKLAVCYYSASNGGQTELPQNVWPAREGLGYYAMTEDPYDLENPESVVRRGKLAKDAGDLPDLFMDQIRKEVKPKLAALGYEAEDPACFRVDEIVSVQTGGHTLGEKNTYVTTLTLTVRWSGRKWIEPSTGDGEDYDLEVMLGVKPAATEAPADEPHLSGWIPSPEECTVTLQIFPDVVQTYDLVTSGTTYQRISVEETDQAFVICARRFGHGVGMSQRGAQWMAGHYGKTYTEILAFYYPGMTLSQIAAGQQAAPTPKPMLAATPGPAATPTPRPTLMPVTGALPEGAYIASVEEIDDDSSLNLRSKPMAGDNLIMRLYKHQQLVVLDVSDDGVWAHVKTDAVEGYVMISFLKRV